MKNLVDDLLSVPRIRGDEPQITPNHSPRLFVFPASAGMNLLHGADHRPLLSVPRIRGDEPFPGDSSDQVFLCSPHPRG